MSFQAALDNRTPFEAASFVVPDPQGQEVLLVVVIAVFHAPGGRSLELAPEQREVRIEDEYWGDPATSSPRYENDLALFKPFVDVLVNGSAHAPQGQPARQVPIEVSVGDVRKRLVVHGERVWAALEPTRAIPFVTMPVIYERAFGGQAERGRAEPRNPVGIGLHGAKPHDPAIMSHVPNVEYPRAALSHRGSRSRPAGLGVIGRGWTPRIGFAGTYDQLWLDAHWPLLPPDFDPRYHQAAPEDQQSSTIRGGEPGHIVNMTPEGVWRFRLPVLDIPVRLLYEDRQDQAPLRMDTVMLEPDDYRITLTCRLTIQTQRKRGPLREVVLGHVRRGWLRARAERKVYIDHSGLDGTDPTRACYHL